MAVDYGEARTGIAVSDSMEIMASPEGLIYERNIKAAALKAAEKAKALRAGAVVVGLPVNMDGSEGGQAEKCREFAAELEETLGISVTLWDERGSTKTAYYYMNEAEIRGKKRKDRIDAAAAAVILQSFLEYRRNAKA